MAEHPVDLATWPRADTFRFFRTYQRPHFATTVRIDVGGLMTRAKPAGVSPYRASLHAIGTGLHAVPELLTRFRGDTVLRHDRVELSMTVPRIAGGFGYAYVPYLPDFAAFDRVARSRIEAVAASGELVANTGERDDLAYLSCLPWLDYSALTNAMPGPEDCIPRVGWGRIVEDRGRHGMAMTLEVHHALVDGVHVGAFFAAVQESFRALGRGGAA